MFYKEYSLLQFPIGGIRNPESGSDAANGKGLCPKAKWNCCCCPRKEITMSKMNTVPNQIDGNLNVLVLLIIS